MSPVVALAGCTVFCLYLLRSDLRTSGKLSWRHWIALTWTIIVGSRPVSLWFSTPDLNSSASVYLEGSPQDRMIFLGLIILGLIGIISREADWREIFHRNALIFLFLVFALVSLLWSDYPVVSFKRWIKLVGSVIMVIIVLSEKDPLMSIRALFRRTAIILIPFSILLIKYYPVLGRSYNRWTGEPAYHGVGVGKNPFGALCLILGIALFWEWVIMRDRTTGLWNRKRIYENALLFSLLVWALNISNSATSLLSMIIGIILVYLLGIPVLKNRGKAIGFITVALIMTVIALQAAFELSNYIIKVLDRDITLTGRIFLWSDLLEMQIHPLTGTGYESFWLGPRLEYLWSKYWWHPNQAHDGYIEVYLNLGIIGLSLLVFILFQSLRSTSEDLNERFEIGRFRYPVIITAMVYNITEAAFHGMHIMWFSLLLVLFNIPEYTYHGETSD